MARAPAGTNEGPRIRGVPLLSFLAALRTIAGYDAVNRTMGALPTSMREAIRYRRIMSNEWYPLAWYRALHSAAQQATGMGPRLARLIGRETTRANVPGIYRVFLLVVSPQALIVKAPSIYQQNFDTGEVQAVECHAGLALLAWRGCAGFDLNIWSDAIGTAEALVELAGAKGVHVDVLSGGGDAAADADMRLTWK